MVLTPCISARHFQSMEFRNSFAISPIIFVEMCAYMCCNQDSNVNLNDGLELFRWQVITWSDIYSKYCRNSRNCANNSRAWPHGISLGIDTFWYIISKIKHERLGNIFKIILSDLMFWKMSPNFEHDKNILSNNLYKILKLICVYILLRLETLNIIFR